VGSLIFFLLLHPYIYYKMALALLGNLASSLLPSVISWGMNKLNGSQIGRGAAKGINYAINKGIQVAKSPAFQEVAKAVKN
jgi:hypothetical protein